MPEHYTFIPRLANVEVRAAESGHFEIPTRAEREDLWPGDLVKLVFLNIGERLWVKVLDCDGTNQGTRRWIASSGKPYSGIIISKPSHSDMSEGMSIDFGPEHVADIAHVSLRRARERQAHEAHVEHRKPHHQKGKPCLPTGR